MARKSLVSLGLWNRVEKLNPGQPYIAKSEGTTADPAPGNYWAYYEQIGVVNRGVNMIVDASSQIDIIFTDEKIAQDTPVTKNVRQSKVEKLLNTEPNPYMDISTFRRLLFMDLLIDGNAFIYYDGKSLYHLPANLVSIKTHPTEYIDGYRMGTVEYDSSEVIHIKDNSMRGVFRGTSRLRSAGNSMRLLWRMTNYQDKFFENGAVPGLILKSPSSLSEKLKQKMIESWLQAYSPNNGGRRPLILDGGMELDRLSNASFKELDFENSISSQENAILKSLGIPPILLDGGNNANIRPNQRLFYIETVIPLVDKVIKAFERYFGYKIIPDNDVPGMQPELQDLASYAVNLVNGGIITPNEGREVCAFEKSKEADMDNIRVPVNVAGSAADPSQGGRPPSKGTP